MNLSNQKRGEWEPVLRHSVNSNVEEEKNRKRQVITFFISSEFDKNTINIWRAVSIVPLESTQHKETFTKNHVVIMPITNTELAKLISYNINYDEFISTIYDKLSKTVKLPFNLNWRNDLLEDITAKYNNKILLS